MTGARLDLQARQNGVLSFLILKRLEHNVATRQMAIDEFVQDAAKRPNVGRLRSHNNRQHESNAVRVGQSSHLVLQCIVPDVATRVNVLGQAKVDQLERAVHEHKTFGGDVACQGTHTHESKDLRWGETSVRVWGGLAYGGRHPRRASRALLAAFASTRRATCSILAAAIH